MKLLIFALTAIFFNLNILSQPNDFMVNPFWNFYSDNHLDAVSSGMGSTGIASVGNLSAVYLNPASMEINGKYQANLQFTFKSRQEYPKNWDIDEVYLKPSLNSGSIGFGYRIFKNLQAGFLYSNPRSLIWDIGEIIETNEFGEEIGRYNGDDRYVNYQFSVPLVYNTDIMRLGLSLNYNMHRRYFNYDHDGTIGKLDRFNIQVGVIITPIKELSIGVTFKPESNGDVKYSSDLFPEIQSDKAILPLEFGTGIQYILKNGLLRFAADYQFTNASLDSTLKDYHQIHLGVEYSVNKNWQVRTGFFTQPDPREPKSYPAIQYNYNQMFLSLGGTFKSKNASFSLAVMDSHISSGDLKYTFINGGINFNF